MSSSVGAGAIAPDLLVFSAGKEGWKSAVRRDEPALALGGREG